MWHNILILIIFVSPAAVQRSSVSQSHSLTTSGGCILPPYPTYGTYEVSKIPNAKPGQALDSFALTIICRRGFGVVDALRGGGNSTHKLYCVNGEYQYQIMPRCVRFCKLNPDPSVRYTCHTPGVGFKTCKNYVAPGTLVNPICNSPIYYSTESFPYMKCNFGYWDYIAQCRAECGRVTPEASGLIIDGKQAKRGELPWHVGVYRKTTVPYTQICGGTLITNKVVLSAAHCFWDDLVKKLPASNYAVAIGKLYRDWDTENDIGAQKSDLIEIRIPSRFQGAAANFQEDIAALILKTPFVYMTYIRPVCVNYDVNFERIQLRQGNSGKVAGWGLTSANGVASDSLQVIDMPFINVDTCIDSLPSSFTEYITGDKFCAGYTTGKALCKGDSGGGLSFPDRGLGVDRFYLRGIVSAAPRDDEKLCNDYVYTTFTMITRHQEFIKEALAVSAEKRCPQYSFQCDDGFCVDQGADCNGRQDCADGSDEKDELCIPGFVPPIPSTTSEPNPLSITSTGLASGSNSLATSTSKACTLPPYPNHGTYKSNTSNSTLTVTCRQGYEIMTSGVSTNHKGIQIYCVQGKWDPKLPKCVRLCQLLLDSSINPNYRCLAPGLVPAPCNEYVSAGTTVYISCKSPDYYSDIDLPPMTCIAGYWDYYPRCRPECGRVSTKATSSAALGVVPWHVGIHRKEPRPYTQICGGSIVSNKVVLSAAHCFWQSDPQPASNFAVAAGKLYRALGDGRDEFAQKSDVEKINMSNRFQGNGDDIAVLILVNPFQFNEYVRPVCLNFDYDLESRHLQDGMLGQIAGWGQTSINENFSPVLLNEPYQYVNLTECHLRLALTEDMFCAGSLDTVKLCEGTGGGGLVFKTSNEMNIERYYLRGIMSRPKDAEVLCNSSPYNAFISIMKHEVYIKQFL